jgi:hypothetical protein
MPGLLPYTDWLGECRRLGLPPETPPPPAYQTFDEWNRNSRGVNQITGQRQLKSYGDLIMTRGKLGLPLDAAPPPGYESHDEWYRRVRALDPATGESLLYKNAAPTAPAQTATGTSGFFRQALSTAGSIASRLGAMGRGLGQAFPAIGATSTIIHAIREGHDMEKTKRASPHDLRADASAATQPNTKARPAAPAIG